MVYYVLIMYSVIYLNLFHRKIQIFGHCKKIIIYVDVKRDYFCYAIFQLIIAECKNNFQNDILFSKHQQEIQ